ncbi:hypothetical protein [uncultured Bacteroides sp.]|uniref:hypothetical protein n=1 Tax=uncultured Bacteroides sp. TaxID=162156 RepID=UPI0025CC67C3|nr:hypothetical protein [uncultured Bacteroides sp.]
MKIINTESRQAYQLAPDTRIEIERPNLFFNEWGEQSFPIDLPDTDLNRRLTGYPDLLANRNKPSANIGCIIQDGEYFMPCRQAVLGARRKEKIQTSFYMNEGSFLARIGKVAVPLIFGDETISGIHTVEEGLRWCWSLRDGKDENYAVFPIIADLDGEKRGVNIVAKMDSSGRPASSREETLPNFTPGFFHSFARQETVNGQIINLAPGYYITPFMRANYLLKRLFQYFGYTLLDNFFTETEPFKSMVFINNTTDSLVNGTIRLAHLVPNCYCSTLLEVFRKKFCCEFIPDETAGTVRIEFFKDLIGRKSETDLSPFLTGYPDIAFQTPRQLKLSSKNSLTEGSTFDSTTDLARKYPTAYYDKDSGKYKRTGYTNYTVFEIVSDGNLPYYAEEEGVDDYEVSVPDCQYCHSSCVYYTDSRQGTSERVMTAPYIGNGNTLNSTLVTSGEVAGNDENPEGELLSSSQDQAPILSFVSDDSTGINTDTVHGYSLLYNGPFGIYEKFYRDFDNLLRNALHKVTVPLLLPDAMKQSLQVHKKVSVNGNDYLIDIMKYAVGGKNEPIETVLLTTKLLEPVSVSVSESERLTAGSPYLWVHHIKSDTLTEKEWTDAGYAPSAKVSVPAIYPPFPTREQYEKGGKYYQRTVYFSSEYRGVFRYYKAEVHLTVKEAGTTGGTAGGRN